MAALARGRADRARSRRWTRAEARAGARDDGTGGSADCARASSSWPRRSSRASACSLRCRRTARSPSAAARTSTRSTCRSTTASGWPSAFAEIRGARRARASGWRRIDAILRLDRPRARRLLRRPRRPDAPAAPGPRSGPAGRSRLVQVRRRPGSATAPGWRLSWMTHAESFYDGARRDAATTASIRPRATGSRVVYAGDVYSFTTRLRLDADGSNEVHGWITKEGHPKPVEFDVPAAATADGALTLTWRQEPGAGGAGRGNQIAEVWLMRGRRERRSDDARRRLAVGESGSPQAPGRRVGLRRDGDDAVARHRGARREARVSTSSGWRWSTRPSRSRPLRHIVLATRGLPARCRSRAARQRDVDGQARARHGHGTA